MRLRLFVFTILGLVARVSVCGQSYQTMVSHGPSSNRVDIVFIGDGYLANQLQTVYPAHVSALVDYMFQGAQNPFPRYKRFFNVHRVNVASNEAGADKPPLGVFVDTALDASYWWDGTTERLLYFDTNKAANAVNAALAGTGIDVDIRFGTVNDSKYGGGGGSWAVYAGANTFALEVALHELGHSYGGLADEYFSSGVYSGGEPNEPNCTRTPSTLKWNRWLGYNDPTTDIGPIGYYEGCRYFANGLYRPSVDSKMRSLNRPFDAISRERFISRIYDEVDPLDSWTSNSSLLVNPLALRAASIDPTVIAVEWSVNGTLVSSSDESLFTAVLGLGPGNHTISVRAYDRILNHAFTGSVLDWWRLPNTAPLQQSISWNVTLTRRLGDFDLDNDLDCGDVDALVSAIASGGHLPGFDLTGDGLVNRMDLNVWLAAAGATNLPTRTPFLPGDANLDGSVDLVDFGLWNANRFTAVAAWCQGDFNADGVVEGSDYGIWNSHKFQTSQRVEPVPEPQTLALVVMLTFGGSRLRSRRRSPV